MLKEEISEDLTFKLSPKDKEGPGHRKSLEKASQAEGIYCAMMVWGKGELGVVWSAVSG